MTKDNYNRDSLKGMILEGLKNGFVEIIQNPNDAGIACQIGDYWFYFMELKNETLTPDEVFECFTKDELANLIYDSMKGLGTNEFNYYCSFLEERIQSMESQVNISEIKVGDYINGKIVEEISVIDGERYYLVTYFDKEIRKPQSLALPEHKVTEFVSAENFKSITQVLRKESL